MRTWGPAMITDRDRTTGFEGNLGIKDPLVEAEDGFDKSPNVSQPHVAGRTPNKDDKRCFYCQEIGHFVDRCYKKARDRRAAAEKNELRILSKQNGERDDPTEYNPTLPAVETDTIYEDSDNDYGDQLNI